MLKKYRIFIIILVILLIGSASFICYRSNSKVPLKDSESVKITQGTECDDTLDSKILRVRNTFEHKGKKFEEGMDIYMVLDTREDFPYNATAMSTSYVQILDNYVMDLETHEKLDKTNYIIGKVDYINMDYEIVNDNAVKFSAVQSSQNIEEIKFNNKDTFESDYKNITDSRISLALADDPYSEVTMINIKYDKKIQLAEPRTKDGYTHQKKFILNKVDVSNYGTDRRNGALKLNIKLPIYNSRTKTYEIHSVELERSYIKNPDEGEDIRKGAMLDVKKV